MEASLLGGLSPLDEGILQAVIGLLRWRMQDQVSDFCRHIWGKCSDDVVRTGPLLRHSLVGKLGLHLRKPDGRVGRPERRNLQHYGSDSRGMLLGWR